MYQIPESYRAYCTNPAVRTAVDHILSKSNKLDVPSDIEWDELPKFHRAVLSAHQVRCEYAMYLNRSLEMHLAAGPGQLRF